MACIRYSEHGESLSMMDFFYATYGAKRTDQEADDESKLNQILEACFTWEID